MKHVLLLIAAMLVMASAVLAQANGQNGVVRFDRQEQQEGANIKIYPNPATSYIGLDQASGVEQVIIFNMVGRQVKRFVVGGNGRQYFVGDLPSGMYLVQLLGVKEQVITTKRLNKR